MTSLIASPRVAFAAPAQDGLWILSLQQYHSLQSQHAYLKSLLIGEPVQFTQPALLSPPSSPSSPTAAINFAAATSSSGLALPNIDEKLFTVNQSLKAVLTSLMNCDTTKRDEEERAWIQERLMYVEMELKGYRRRRSSANLVGLSRLA